MPRNKDVFGVKTETGYMLVYYIGSYFSLKFYVKIYDKTPEMWHFRVINEKINRQ